VTVTFDDRGIKVFGLYFTCKELLSSGWLHRHSSVNRPKNLEAAYDPSDANNVYLFLKTNKLEIWTCKLAPHSRQYKDRSFWDVFVLKNQQKKMDAGNSLTENKHAREFEEFVEDLTANAIKRKSTVVQTSKRSQIAKIKDNKKAEIDKAREERILDVDPEQQEASLDAHEIPNDGFDDDLDFPDSVDSLFDDED
jgi:hypothetical protein